MLMSKETPIPCLARPGVGRSRVGWRLEEVMHLCPGLGFLEADTEAEFGVRGVYEGLTPMKEEVKASLDRRKDGLQCRPGEHRLA